MIRSLIPALVLASLLAAAASPAAVRHAAGPRPDKAEDPSLVTVRTVFDCTGRDTLTIVPGFAMTITDTTDGASLLDAYASCRGWAETGPEHIFRLEVPVDVELWASVRAVEPDVDLDLFLLDGCDTESCVLGENIELAAALTAGTYWLVVDGYGSASVPDSLKAGAYTLELEARSPGVPAEICDGGVAEPIVCTVGGTFSRSGTLFGLEDRVQAYDCNPWLARAGEAWFAIELLPGQAINAATTAVADSLDVVLWLFDGCGPDARCLAVADAALAGGNEALGWQSEVAAADTVYLAVDGARPPATSTAGEYDLGITCGTEVPVRETSFGGLRGLYR
jgi:hypothetical protein